MESSVALSPLPEKRGVLHTAVCFAAHDLRRETQPFSSGFMATCPGESINHYIYGHFYLHKRSEEAPSLATLSPGLLGASRVRLRDGRKPAGYRGGCAGFL